jgi:hypothetical protein
MSDRTMNTSMNTNESKSKNSPSRKARRAPGHHGLWKEWQARTMSMLSLLTADGQESEEMVQAKLALYAEFLPKVNEAIRSALASADAARGTKAHRELVRLVMLALRVGGAASWDIENMLDDADVENAHECCAALAEFGRDLDLHLQNVERVLLGAMPIGR